MPLNSKKRVLAAAAVIIGGWSSSSRAAHSRRRGAKCQRSVWPLAQPSCGQPVDAVTFDQPAAPKTHDVATSTASRAPDDGAASAC